MIKANKLLRFLGLAILAYLVIFGIYALTSVNVINKAFYLQMRRFIPCAIAIAASSFLWLNANLASKKLFPHLLLGFAWILSFNLFYWFTFHKTENHFDNYTDIVFGSYLIAATICLRLLLLTINTNTLLHKFQAVVMAFLETMFFIIPAFQIYYYLTYHTSFSVNAAIAILQTNPAEAREFILLNLGYFGLFVFGLVCLCFFFCYFRLNLINDKIKLSSKLLLLITIIFMSTAYYSTHILRETGVLGYLQDAKTYLTRTAEFHQKHETNFDNMQVTIPKIQPAQPSTIIMVIGESATRSYMSAYNYKEHATTPWLAEMSASKNLLLFQHAYASAGQTVLSLERALTEKNQYNSLEFSNSLTIIDLAKKAGYTTYWFSGQGRIGGSDTPITLVANTADHAYWLEDEKSNKVTYDSDLLPYLKKLDPHQNNFVVFHIMGSHENYINRYPASFTKWGKPGVTDSILNYDNSLAFTDQFLKDVYTYAKDNLNLQAMLYFSDHGADPLTKRHPDLSGFVALRIPLALYLSPEYQSLYPETTATLKNHLNTYFTNDLIYELVAGILNIKSNHYDESNGLASPSYKYNRETLRTHIGKNKLTEDIDEH